MAIGARTNNIQFLGKLVIRRPLSAINNENIYDPFRRLQTQSQLALDRRKDRWPSRASVPAALRLVVEAEIVVRRETGLVNHCFPKSLRKILCEYSHRSTPSLDLSSRPLNARLAVCFWCA